MAVFVLVGLKRPHGGPASGTPHHTSHGDTTIHRRYLTLAAPTFHASDVGNKILGNSASILHLPVSLQDQHQHEQLRSCKDGARRDLFVLPKSKYMYPTVDTRQEFRQALVTLATSIKVSTKDENHHGSFATVQTKSSKPTVRNMRTVYAPTRVAGHVCLPKQR